MTFESHQDFSTTLARISAITLGGSPELKAYRNETRRTETNDNQAQFEEHLHYAMGYKASTVNDWAV